MSAKMMWSVIVEGPTPDAGSYTLANFSTKERAEREKDKMEAAALEKEKNTDSSIWGGWSVFPNRFYVRPAPVVIEDDEEFTPLGYFLVFSTAGYNDDKTKIVRVIDHVEYVITYEGAALVSLTDHEVQQLKKLQEPGTKYVQWNTPSFYADDAIAETMAAFDINDIPLEVEVSEVVS